MNLIICSITLAFRINPDIPQINEVCSKTEQIISDEDDDFSDWIEIYNDTKDTLLLHHYYLSDDKTELDKWQFPSFLLAPQNYILVFASDKDRQTTEWHTNFKISSKGEDSTLGS